MKNVFPKALTLLLALVIIALSSVAFAQGSGKEASLASAVAAFKSKDYKSALNYCNQAIRANPTDVGAHYYKALSLHYMNQISQAKQEYEWVAKTGNNSLAANAQKALAGLEKRSSSYQGSGSSSASSGTTSTSSSGGYSRYSSRKPKVLDFYTTWCGPCKMLAPILETVERSYSGRVEFQRLDAEAPQNASLVSQYKIKAYPTVIFLDRNGKEAQRMRGVPGGSEAEVADALKHYIDPLLK
ncbi:MAG TPA: thioredoxin family protein [Candidatus Melainabacteria bacterium]|nr:thioredoxin family protein [Candidatus Melainabacteria bacterium]